MKKRGEWFDIIEEFLTLTQGINSPRIFRLWCAIALTAGALERRVWAVTGQRNCFANLYTILVAPPGVGKFIIEDVREIWTSVREPESRAPAFKVSPDNMTKASLIDTLAKAERHFLPPKEPPYAFHSLLIAAEEMQVLLPDYDKEYIGALNSIWNNKTLHTEVRRHGPAREVSIEFPQLNILSGAQPSYFASTFPEDAWATGFARRTIMVYSSTAPFVELFDSPRPPEGLRLIIESQLARLSQLYGAIDWDVEAANEIATWHRRGSPPVPTHSKLVHYNRTRSVFAVKLSMISALARTGKMRIMLEDVLRARDWLIEAEALMPDIFREMVGKSDAQVIEEVHYIVTALWAKNGRKAITGDLIMKAILGRVPSEKAERIFSVMDRANIIQREAGTTDLWIPRPRGEAFGVE